MHGCQPPFPLQHKYTSEFFKVQLNLQFISLQALYSHFIVESSVTPQSANKDYPVMSLEEGRLTIAEPAYTRFYIQKRTRYRFLPQTNGCNIMKNR